LFKKTPLEQWIYNKILGSAGETGQLTRTLIESYQLTKLRETIALAGEKSLFYRDALGRFPIDKIRSIKDLQELPFTTADDLSQNPLRFLCCSQDEIKRIVTLESSGTTGLPKRIFFTSADQELTKDFFHHGMTVIAQPGDKVLILLPGERPGSVGELFAESVQRMDVLAVPHGLVIDPGSTLKVMEREKVDTLLGIPVQVLALACYEPPGENKFRLNIKNVVLNTDNVPRAIINQIKTKWDCRVFNHYAMTEMGLGGGLECEALAGYHMREADLLFEIINPVTGEVLPEGEEGEVVFTTLTRRGMPLIRYRTGDFARFIPGPCPCGTVLKRMAPVRDRVKGRITLAGGGFLSMSLLDEALFKVSGVLDFDADVTRRDGVDYLSIHVQAACWASKGIPGRIEKALLSVPVIAENKSKGSLALGPVQLSVTERLRSPKKRVIQDLRGKETHLH